MEWVNKLGEAEAAFLGAIVGALVGAFGSYFAGRALAFHTSRQRKDVLMKSLYSEVYNRVARCALDTSIWRDYVEQVLDVVSGKKFQKFRPADLWVLNSLGAEIGLLGERVLSPLLMFHFRLDAIRRDIDASPDGRLSSPGDVIRFQQDRFEPTLASGLSLLTALAHEIRDKQSLRLLDTELEKEHRNWLDGAVERAFGNDWAGVRTLPEILESMIEAQPSAFSRQT